MSVSPYLPRPPSPKSLMTKRHYEMLTQACQEIENGLPGIVNDAVAYPECNSVTNAIMELVVARIALVCAYDNSNFDSFKFNAAARKRST